MEFYTNSLRGFEGGLQSNVGIEEISPSQTVIPPFLTGFKSRD